MMESAPKPSVGKAESLPADFTTVLFGVVTIVGGVATGLFSDLRPLGQVIGLLAFACWVIAIGLILWGPEPRTLAPWVAGMAFGLTAALLVYAFVTGPRLNSRTLVLTPSGLDVINAACPGAANGSEVTARIALNQLGDQFVHIEVIEPGCERAEKDIRIRSEDLRGVFPAP
jgi:predicted MFS family arabinose efflux permease